MPPKKAAAGGVPVDRKSAGGSQPAKPAAKGGSRAKRGPAASSVVVDEPVPAAAAPPAEVSIAEALLSEQRVDALQAYRRVLVSSILQAKPAEMAALVRESRSVLAELDAAKPKQQSTAESLRSRSVARRQQRRVEAAAMVPGQEGRRNQRRRTTGTHRNGAT